MIKSKSNIQNNPKKVKSFKRRRAGYFNYDTRMWETFYVNKYGGLTIDQKNLTYDSLKKEINKNAKRKDVIHPLQQDVYNKKISKIKTMTIKNRFKQEKEINSVIKKTARKEKVTMQELENIDNITKKSEYKGYRTDEISRVFKQKRKKRIPIKGDIITPRLVSAVSIYNGTSSHFHFSNQDASNLLAMGKAIKGQYDKLHIQFKIKDVEYSGNLSFKDFKDKDTLDKAMSDILSSGGFMPHSLDDNIKLLFKGIKK